MLGRTVVAPLRSCILVAVLCGFAGCESGNPEVAQDECLVDKAMEPVRTCFPTPLSPELDPESPDYGRVSCVVVVSGTAETPFCDCTARGYGPASAAQAALAEEELDARGLCENGCCDNRCFCVLEQLAGEELAYCQGRSDREAGPDFSPHGWCYVDADVELGDPSLVASCPDTQRRLLLFVPLNVQMGGSATLACLQ